MEIHNHCWMNCIYAMLESTTYATIVCNEQAEHQMLWMRNRFLTAGKQIDSGEPENNGWTGTFNFKDIVESLFGNMRCTESYINSGINCAHKVIQTYCKRHQKCVVFRFCFLYLLLCTDNNNCCGAYSKYWRVPRCHVCTTQQCLN